MKDISLPHSHTGPWDILAGTRFLLAAIVLFGHAAQFLNLSNGIATIIASFSSFSAVLGFLVISGYSIAHSITRQLDGFYRRRLLRIYPLYVLAIFASIPPEIIHHDLNRHTIHMFLGHLVFLQTFRFPPLYYNTVMWSLAVEVVFYALAPLFVRIKTPLLIGLTSISALGFLLFPFLNLPYFAFLRHGEPAFFLGWSWMAGFLYYRVRLHEWAGLALICGMVLITSLNSIFNYGFYEVTITLTMLAIVKGANLSIHSLVRRVLAYSGELSYPLYLFHFPLGIMYVDWLHYHRLWPFIAICLVFSAIMVTIDQLIRPYLAAAMEVIERSLRRNEKANSTDVPPTNSLGHVL